MSLTEAESEGLPPEFSIPDVLIVGIGNDMRGDDAAGLLAVRQLRPRLERDPRDGELPYVQILESSGEMTSLIDAWQGVGHAILIDCALSGAPAGTVQRFELLGDNSNISFVPASVRLSSHSLDLAGALDLARVLNKTPARLTLYTIEGGSPDTSFEVGAPASDEVIKAVNEVVRRVVHEVQAASQQRVSC